jgi:dTDP-4-amino-4,6-dideoxygalactose transaminase
MAAAEAVLDSQQFIFGEKLEGLEKSIAEYSGCQYATGVSSGTDALLISLMTARIGRGDLVITTPYTFFATAGSIVRQCAEPVFVDIDPRTYNIDPAAITEKIHAMSKAQRARLKAIIPVHLYGQCADMEPIMKLAEEHDLIIIEDAAQAIGAEYQYSGGMKKRAGSMGHFGCFSFYPTKNLGGFGEGGMVTTNDEKLYRDLRAFRHHGDTGRYEHKFVGGNFRLDAIQAALLLVKYKYLDEWNKKRIKNADYYVDLIEKEGLTGIIPPCRMKGRHVYHQFIIRVLENRDDLMQFLNKQGIGCAVYYPVPLHMQECFHPMHYAPGDFPESMKAASETLALPIYPELSEEQINYVVDNIKKFMTIGKNDG